MDSHSLPDQDRSWSASSPQTKVIALRLDCLWPEANLLAYQQTGQEASHSPDGRWVAWGAAEDGGDLLTWRITPTDSTPTDIAHTGTGAPLLDVLTGVYASGVVWLPTGAGLEEAVVYNRRLPLFGTHALYLHRIGTPQSADIAIYHRPEQPDAFFLPEISPEGEFLLITCVMVRTGENALLCKPRSELTTPAIVLVADVAATLHLVGQQGQTFFMRQSSADQPNGCIVAIDWQRPSHQQMIVPMTDDPIQDAVVADERIAVSYLHHACARLALFALDGRCQKDVTLPGRGTITQLSASIEPAGVAFVYSDFATPPTRLRHPLAADVQGSPLAPELEPTSQPERQSAFSDSDTPISVPGISATVEQFWVTSADGVSVPLWLAAHAPFSRTGGAPTLLLAYGGFGESLTPRYDPAWHVWMEMGGALALVNARGGGELGRAWHLAAVGRHKPRTFADVIAAAEWLVAQGITQPTRLGLYGESNGGLTAAVCLTQRPELFGAVVIASGLTDMLRYDQLGSGAVWLNEYGSPQQPQLRQVLRSYSPLHNLRPGVSYPPTLITTARCDPRVGEAHSLTFADALQAATGGDAPIVLRVDETPGHGDRRNRSQAIAHATDWLSFLAHHLQVKS